MENESNVSIESLAARLTVLETAVASLVEKNRGKNTGDKDSNGKIDFSAAGGKLVGHHTPIKGEKEIRFEHLGGKLVERSPLWKDEPEKGESKEEDNA